MPHVEQQFHLPRRTELVSEAQHLDAHRYCFGRGFEALKQELSQSVHSVIGGVDYFIGLGAHARHRSTFGPDGVAQTFATLSRVWPPRLAEAPGIAGLGVMPGRVARLEGDAG